MYAYRTTPLQWPQDTATVQCIKQETLANTTHCSYSVHCNAKTKNSAWEWSGCNTAHTTQRCIPRKCCLCTQPKKLSNRLTSSSQCGQQPPTSLHMTNMFLNTSETLSSLTNHWKMPIRNTHANQTPAWCQEAAHHTHYIHSCTPIAITLRECSTWHLEKMHRHQDSYSSVNDRDCKPSMSVTQTMPSP